MILKADGFPTYHMAVVVDDHLMGINTVVRGEEWISSTPKHILLYQWLGWDLPKFAHMPLLRNTDKSKISKRKNPAARLMWFKEEGYLPEAVRNFLQLLGYAGDDEQEVKSFEQFVEEFDWAKVNTVGPIFDLQKLDWLNGHYIRSLSPEELADRIIAFEEAHWTPSEEQVEVLRKAVPIIQERLVLLKDALPQLDYLFVADGDLTLDEDSVAALADNAAEVLDAAIEVAESVDFATDAIQAGLKERIVEGMGIKPKFAFAPIRVAISGRRVSPPLFESMEILGRDSSLARLKVLRAHLSSSAPERSPACLRASERRRAAAACLTPGLSRVPLSVTAALSQSFARRCSSRTWRCRGRQAATAPAASASPATMMPPMTSCPARGASNPNLLANCTIGHASATPRP